MASTKFLKTYLKDYRVGAVTRSSSYVIARIIKQLQPEDRVIVEYGAGDGVITRKLLDALPSDARVIALEINKDLLEDLRTIDDPRLTVHDADVRQISKDFSRLGLSRIDAVISGIPFTYIKSAARREIVSNTYYGLRSGGRFIVYQYSPLMLPYLKHIFKNVRVIFEARNFLPYVIMVATKK